LNHSSCASIRSSFSAYLDGAVNGHEMQQISRHIEGFDDMPACEGCAAEFAAWRSTQEALSTLGPAKPPADLGLKLRLAISREQARRSSRMADRLSLYWDNALRAAVMQVSAGVAGTVVLVGSVMLLGIVAAPQPVLANDEPLGAITAPHYLYSTVSPGPIMTGRDTAIVVEAAVDSTGRVYDYTIVSGPRDTAVRTQVESQLLGSIFKPASVFGLPVKGRAVVTFAGISVRG
jgi:hypothetical protein